LINNPCTGNPPACAKLLKQKIRNEPDTVIKEQLKAKLLRLYLQNDQEADAVLFLIDEGTEEAIKQRIPNLLDKKQIPDCQQLLSQIPFNNAENIRFHDLFDMLVNICGTGRSYKDLTPGEKQILLAVANTPSKVAANAESINKWVNNVQYYRKPEELNNNARLDNLQSESLAGDSDDEDEVPDMNKPVTEPVSFTIVPNPLVERGVVQYKLNENSDFVVMEVYNVSGKQVRSYMLYKYNDSFVINTAGLKNGTYLIKIIDDRLIKTLKMVILK